MHKLLSRVFDIREGEGLRALLMFSYIFLLIASLLIIKPVRNSLFLTRFGVEQLPYAFTLVAILAALVTVIYSKFANHIRLNRLILSATGIIIAQLLGFWTLLHFEYSAGWFIYFFYVWVAIFAVIITSQFWLLANYVFNAREARRLFGFVGAGAIAGGILGGYLTKFFAAIVGTANLILVCVFFLSICMVIIQFVWKISARNNYRERMQQQKRLQQKSSEKSALSLIFRSKHLSFLASIVGISVLVANLVDYQFNAIAVESITDKDELTAFFGFWLSNLSIFSLLIQVFFTSRILKYFGVGTSLFILPVGVLTGAILIIFNPALWAAILMKVSEGAFKQSVNKAGLELVSLPIPAAVKNKVKTFIDVFIDNFSTGLSGLLLIIITLGFKLHIGYISAISVVLIFIWLYLNYKLKAEYVESFRTAIEQRSIDLETQTVNLDDAAVIDSMIKVLDGKNERRILYVLDLLENVKNERFLPYFRKLIAHPSSEVKVKVLSIISNYDNDLVYEAAALLESGSHEERVAALHHLCKHSLDPIATLEKALVHDDIHVQNSAIMCAAMQMEENPSLIDKIAIAPIVHKIQVKLQKNTYNFEDKIHTKINIVQVIGMANLEELYPILRELLDDANMNVQIAAIMSAGKTCSEEFSLKLLQFLDAPRLRKYAREALAECGEDNVEILTKALQDSDSPPNIKIAIPRVLALIGTQAVVNVLFDALDNADQPVRRQIVKALSNLHENFPLLNFNGRIVQEKIWQEQMAYLDNFAILSIHNTIVKEFVKGKRKPPLSAAALQASSLLEKTLRERLDDSLKRLFRFLGLSKLEGNDLRNAYKAIHGGHSDARANAIEYLENVLDSDLKAFIIPIIESPSLDNLLSGQQFKTKNTSITRKNCYNKILDGNDNWLKCCTLYWLAASKISFDVAHVQSLVNDNDYKICQSAQFALDQMK
ncbi:MAG: hypothetical protein DWQ05_06445 [Calditrichaeota bacterium]|nr:MAG: hypothetical protein DWQ05_06445 [Calditrichota bacterium]